MKFLIADLKHYKDFRLDDVLSVLKLYSIEYKFHRPIEEVRKSIETNPFVAIEIDSEENIKKFLSRCLSVKHVFELIHTEKGPNPLNVVKSLPKEKKHFFQQKMKSFMMKVDVFGGKKLENKERTELIKEVFSSVEAEGIIKLDNPDLEFYLLADFDKNDIYLARKIGSYNKKSINKVVLNQRPYIGPTSTDARLSFLMANKGLVNENSLVYDPFVGTGSILVAAAEFGAVVFGSDICIKTLRGNFTEKNIFKNFKKYKINRPELIRMDNSNSKFRFEGFFDSIICDPPYGIRAGAKKTINTNETKETYHKKTEKYFLDDLIEDLMNLSSIILKPKGRLVFLYPVPRIPVPYENPIPKHSKFKLISKSFQLLCNSNCNRLLITMEKI